MKTALSTFGLNDKDRDEADRILRSCVHCGFCLPTCPTYKIEKNELDSPRGRIYLMKEMLEGNPVTEKTRLHLDRCLTCQSCETTCPSGVEYHKLLNIGRKHIEKQVPRSAGSKFFRFALRWLLTKRKLFTLTLRLGQFFRWALPKTLSTRIPEYQKSQPWPQEQHTRKMLVLQGCVQPGISPNINKATARVLSRLGIGLLTATDRCCGALSFHLNAQEEGLAFAKNNIDAWWPFIEQGAEAIVITASGCGTFIKQYATMFADAPDYKDKASRLSAMALDISEILARENLDQFQFADKEKLAFHNPCTLQHGQGLKTTTEDILKQVGFELTGVTDSHICCGAAGTNAIFEPSIANQLRTEKLASLTKGKPEVIATANIGCLTHLQSRSKVPVKHWIEILDEAMAQSPGGS